MTYRSALCLSAAVAAIAAQPGAAHAADAATSQPGLSELDTIVVTARKREESLQQVPAVVDAVTGARLEELGGADSTQDLVQLFGGVTFIDAASNNVAEPNIRGAGQARNPNSDSAIGLYRDGAFIAGGNLGGRTFQRFDLFDVERVEVLRGPQPGLYGRDAVGGAINVISKRPVFTQEGEVHVAYGERQDVTGRLIVNLPVNDAFAIRLGAEEEKRSQGVYRRSDTGRYYDVGDYKGVRFSGRYRPSDRLDVVFTADYADQHDDPGATFSATTSPNTDVYQINTRSDSSAQQSNFGLSATLDLDWATLVSTTNYRKRKSDAYTDQDGLAGKQVGINIDEAETKFQELRLQGARGKLNWLVGADLFYLKDSYLVGQRGLAPVVVAMKTVDPNNNQFTDADQKSYSVFASADTELTDRLAASVEARYSWDHKSEVLDDRLLDGSPLLVAFPPGSPQAMPSGGFENFSWGATGSYKFTPDIMAFLRVATAYRAGGFNAQLGKPCGPGDVAGSTCNLITPPPAYDPEHSIDYELGLKTAWFEHRLLLNANVYDVETHDILANLNNGIPVMMDPLDGAMFLQNAGDGSQWGFEVEMIGDVALPNDQGRLTANWTFSRQEGQFTSTPQILSLTVKPGNSLARLRPYALQGDMTYTRPLAEGWILQASSTFNGEWGGYQGADNTQILDDHAIVGGRLALQSRHLVFAVRATNLLNARYHTNGSGTQITPTKGDLFRLNNPRYVEASVTYRW